MGNSAVIHRRSGDPKYATPARDHEIRKCALGSAASRPKRKTLTSKPGLARGYVKRLDHWDHRGEAQSSRRAALGLRSAAGAQVTKTELTEHCRIAAKRWHLSGRSAITTPSRLRPDRRRCGRSPRGDGWSCAYSPPMTPSSMAGAGLFGGTDLRICRRFPRALENPLVARLPLSCSLYSSRRSLSFPTTIFDALCLELGLRQCPRRQDFGRHPHFAARAYFLFKMTT